jgi:hypothetical protein
MARLWRARRRYVNRRGRRVRAATAVLLGKRERKKCGKKHY